MPETTQFAGMNGTIGGYNSLQAGTVLLARYKILGVLGGGGQGAVYQARDLNFPDVKKLVAVKEMLNPATDPSLRASTVKTFQREANILATLSHPAIPKIYDFFDWNERAYLVMEYIHGNDLEELLSKTKSLPVEKVIEWAIDLCDVLEYLHNHQPEPIIFRDMKPANVMIDNLGKVRLIDFGIAKTFQPNVKHTMIGTEGYSAPEQYKGNVTPLSDIYSLGATLHHVLSRRDPRLEPPFSFNDRPLLDFNDKVPRELADIIEKAIEFEPDKRFQSCLEMKQALEALRYRPLNVAAGNGAIASASARENEVSSFLSDTLSGQPEPRWRFKTEDEIRSNPTSYRDMALVGSYDTNVWALNLQTGELIWKFATNGGIASSPVVDEENRSVLFGSEDHSFYSVDIRTGKINWSYRTEGRIRSTAQIAHGRVLFGSDDGFLYALIAATGRFVWKFDMGAEIQSSPFVTNDLIIVGSSSGEVAAIDLSGGKRKWGVRSKRAVLSSPFVDPADGMCYFGSLDHHVYAVDANSGYTSWRFRTRGPVISSPISRDGVLYFGSADGNFYAISAQTSKEKWKLATDKPIVSSPILFKDTVYFGGTDEYLYCLDINNGKERWKFKTGGAITSKPHISGDVLLVGSMDRTLYALPIVG